MLFQNGPKVVEPGAIKSVVLEADEWLDREQGIPIVEADPDPEYDRYHDEDSEEHQVRRHEQVRRQGTRVGGLAPRPLDVGLLYALRSHRSYAAWYFCLFSLRSSSALPAASSRAASGSFLSRTASLIAGSSEPVYTSPMPGTGGGNCT